MNWDKNKKPPADVCPKAYCFHWVPLGGAADMSGRSYATLAEAIQKHDEWDAFLEGGCGCSFGRCTRLDPIAGDADWYEPEEFLLARDGLPWFYFIPSTANLIPGLHEEYLRESKSLWDERPENDLG